MEIFFQSEQYKNLKAQYEKECFKLFGAYCWFDGDKITNKSQTEMKEYFKNKKVTVTHTVEIEGGENVTEHKGDKQTKTITLKRNPKMVTSTYIKSFYEVWSEDPSMREYKEIIFDCNIKKVREYQFNLFSGFDHFDALPSKALDMAPIFEHIRTLCNYKEPNFEYILDYFAHLVQKPWELPHVSLIFITAEGVGKDIFISFLNNVVNEKYTYNTEKLDLVCGKFNSTLGGKLLITLNETNPVDSRDRIENLKFLITAEKVTIEGKHKDPIKADNFARFVFFSNRLFAFPVEEGSRRPKIEQASEKYLKQNIGIEENHKYFSNLIKIFKDQQYQKAFLEFLLKRDITKFNPQNFEKSDLHQILEENSVCPIVGFLAEIVKEAPEGEDFTQIGTTETLQMFQQYMKEKQFQYTMTQKKFNVELESTYKVKKIKSRGGCMFFQFDVVALKTMLETKYKYDFDATEELDADLKSVNKPSPLDHGVISNIDYKAQYEEAMKRIAQLEALVKPVQVVNEPEVVVVTKKKKKDNIKIVDESSNVSDLEKDLQNLVDQMNF